MESILNKLSYNAILTYFGYKCSSKLPEYILYTQDNYFDIFIFKNINHIPNSYCPFLNNSFDKANLFFLLSDIFPTTNFNKIKFNESLEEIVPEKSSTESKLLNYYFHLNQYQDIPLLSAYSVDSLIEHYNFNLYSKNGNICFPLFDENNSFSNIIVFNEKNISLLKDDSSLWTSDNISEATDYIISCNPFSFIHYLKIFCPENTFFQINNFNIKPDCFCNYFNKITSQSSNIFRLLTSFYPQEYLFISNIVKYWISFHSKFTLDFSISNYKINFYLSYDPENVESYEINKFISDLNVDSRNHYCFDKKENSAYYKYFKYKQKNLDYTGFCKTVAIEFPLKPYVFKFFCERLIYFIFPSFSFKILYTDDFTLEEFDNISDDSNSLF